MDKRSSTPSRTRSIASPANAVLKVFRKALAEGSTRDGWVAIEGPRLIEEAIRCGSAKEQSQTGHQCALRSVLVSESAAPKFSAILKRIPRDAEIVQIPAALFGTISQTETPQGIAALVELPTYNLDDCLRREGAVLLVACGIQDPGNLGTILRTSDALGVTAVVTARGTVSLFNPKVVRASGGALFRLPVFATADFAKLMGELREAGVRTIAADSAAGISIAEMDLRGRIALLVGSEAAGVGPEIARQASARARILMKPGVDSMNAAVAASIILYETQRQRGFRFDQPAEVVDS
ncbi:MAG TPA: RNA methyltransferase [Terriglobia bacterium]|nr:RNA methyltransferase [Terriglobia bacterium]